MAKAKKTSKKTAARKPRQKKFIPFSQKNLLTLKGLTEKDLQGLFDLTKAMKKSPQKYLNTLKGKTLGLIFQKPSSRTRASFEVGMAQLGGQGIYLQEQEIQMGEREPVRDVARTLSGYFDGLVLRTFSQSTLEEFSSYATIPTINGLSDVEHPCQALSDLYTIYEKYGKLKGINLTYIGDSNNVSNSLLYGAALMGMNVCIVSPRGYEPPENLLKEVKVISRDSGSKISLSNNPFSSLKNTHIVYTDVWVSMGQEAQRAQKLRDFQSFQVSQTIVSKALPDALVMHCLPAKRGEEITDEVIEGAHSIVFEQAANKLHAQKALLTFMLNQK